MEQLLLGALKTSLFELISLVGPLFVIGLILGFIERKSNMYFFKAFGYKGILATAWLGTPVHELGHAFMCLIFGHKITDIKLLTLNRSNGTLGYVSHSYNRKSIYQSVGNLFIGMAPLITGIGVLFLCLHFFLPKSFSVYELYLKTQVLSKPADLTSIREFFNSSALLFRTIFTLSNLLSLNFWIFLVIAICVSSHIALSWADIEGAAQGLIALFFVLFSLSTIGSLLNINTYGYITKITHYTAYIVTLSELALIFSFFSLAIGFIVYQIPRKTTQQNAPSMF
ncbi:hypothetical protein Desaci_0328 [Desulfosporosinus acidiphilus SJ4]|uniref:Uncharacterized protein n=1 Tax=Desulfosporosinus acidiphilus (strain DSM 22704 / JCM 16185 / SJ4) TaxID=646529 RepID=I4D0S6_DESAJ|nr:hypothetical protein [Desulfosporosinus acidiphilus]AFM39400.1 hypothetical protein Desaci_0328 [Desulfosporosinus acidiphilus SJ4]